MPASKKRSPYGAVKYKTVDEYHAHHSAPASAFLEAIRGIARKAAPACEEVISYNMPSFRGNRIIFYYAAHSFHGSIYPVSIPADLKEDLTDYHTSKGTLQFPYEKKLPVTLIRRLIKRRVEEDAQALAKKSKVKKNSAKAK